MFQPNFHEKKVICNNCKVWSDSKSKLKLHICYGLITLVNNQSIQIGKTEELQQIKTIKNKDKLELTNITRPISQENPDQNPHVKRSNTMTGKLLAQTIVESIESSSKLKCNKSNKSKRFSSTLSKPPFQLQTTIVKSDQEESPFRINSKANPRKPPCFKSPTNNLIETKVDDNSRLVQHFANQVYINAKQSMHKVNLVNQKFILKERLVKNENEGKLESTDIFGEEVIELNDGRNTALLEDNGNSLKTEDKQEERQSDRFLREKEKRAIKCMSLFEDEPSSDDDCVQIDSTGKQELTIIKQEPTIMNPETIHMKQETISKTDMKDWFQFSPIKRSPAKSYSRRFKKSIE